MILGLLYRQYYNHAEGDVLKQTHLSDYTLNTDVLSGIYTHWGQEDPWTGPEVWMQDGIRVLQGRSCKIWSGEVEQQCWLLEPVGLPLLEQRRSYDFYSKSIMACVCHFPPTYLLLGTFLTTLGWIPCNYISAVLHGLCSSQFLYESHFSLNMLLGLFLS